MFHVKHGPPFLPSVLRAPPLLERGHGLVALHRAVLQPQFQQMLVRLSDDRARAHTEDLHDLIPVEIRPDGVQLLLLLELLMRLL